MRSSTRLGISLYAAAAALVALPAAPQYRENSPPVLEQRVTESEKVAALKAFRSRYQAAGRPRVAVYWNVELTADTTSIKSEVVEEAKKGKKDDFRSEKSTRGEAGASSIVDSGTQYSDEARKSSTSRLVDPGYRKSLLAERDELMLQSAFSSALRNAGMPITDRSAIIRKAHGSRFEAADPKRHESLALTSSADMLLEILETADKDAALGIGFRLSLRNLKNGTEVFSLYSRGVPIEATKEHLVATDRGFERRKVMQQYGLAEMGEALAWDVVRAFAAAKTGQLTEDANGKSNTRGR